MGFDWRRDATLESVAETEDTCISWPGHQTPLCLTRCVLTRCYDELPWDRGDRRIVLIERIQQDRSLLDFSQKISHLEGPEVNLSINVSFLISVDYAPVHSIPLLRIEVPNS